MKGDMRKYSIIRIKELRDNRKNKSISEILPHYPFEGFDCSVGSLASFETATGAIKASFP